MTRNLVADVYASLNGDHFMPVSPLEMPDSHYLSAAVGWLELGNAQEAAAELARMSPAVRCHPDVLEVRWAIYAERGDWLEGLKAAQTLVQEAPERPTGWLHRAYALRRVPDGGLKQAWDALLPAFDKFPKEQVIAYNLACYACQMQQLEDTRRVSILSSWVGWSSPPSHRTDLATCNLQLAACGQENAGER